MTKYPIVKIRRLNTENVYNGGFILEALCRHDSKSVEIEVSIEGTYNDKEDGCLEVHEFYSGIGLIGSRLIGTHDPEIKMEYILPCYKKRLKELINKIAKKELKLEEIIEKVEVIRSPDPKEFW